VNIDEWLGSRLLLTQVAKTAAAPAASPIFDPSVKILLKPSYADRSSLTLVSYRFGETSDLLPSLFVCLFVWYLTAHQHKKAISAKNQ